MEPMKPRTLLPVPFAALVAALAFAGAGVGAVSSALADDDGYRDTGYRDNGYRDRDHDHGDDDDDDDDHDRARRALQSGEVLPLAEILTRLASVAPGRVIETELEFDDGRYIYEFKLISPGGRLMEAEVDATSGRLIELEDED